MRKSLSGVAIGALSCVTALVPASAFAYLSPEAVFGNQTTTFNSTDPTLHQAPPLQREGDAVILPQQQSASSSRAAAQHSLTLNTTAPVATAVPPTKHTARLDPFD